MFTKYSWRKILNLNFEKMTVHSTEIFWFNDLPFLHQKGYNDAIYSPALECNVWIQLISYAKHEFENLKAQNSRAAH